MNKGGMLGNIIGAFVAILIGVSLFPLIVEQLNVAQAEMNVTNPGSEMATTMLKLLPAFFVITIAIMAITMVANALRSVGLFGRERDYDKYSEPTKEETRKKDEEKSLEKYNYQENNDDGDKVIEMTTEAYEKKKKNYEDAMKSFRNKKVLLDKDLEKNL